MELRHKIARMALGYDHYELSIGKAESFPSKEYVEILEEFHKNTMKFLLSLDVYDNDDRLGKVKELQALLKHGEDIKEFVLDGNLHTDNQERRWRVYQGD